jgi:hypothetical protein
MSAGPQEPQYAASLTGRVVAGIFSVLMVAFLGWCTFLAQPGQRVEQRSLQLFCIGLVIALLTWFLLVLGNRKIHAMVKAMFVGLLAGVGTTIGCSISLGLFERFLVGHETSNLLWRDLFVDALPFGAALGVAVAHLLGLSQLGQLYLANTPFTDAGLEHVAKLPALTLLDLTGTQITDAGLANLANASRLGALTLDNTRITDAGLVHLSKLGSLHWLSLEGTQVTPAGVERLRKALPKARFATVEEGSSQDSAHRSLDS